MLLQNFNDTFYDNDIHQFIGIRKILSLNIVSISFLILIILSIALYFLFFHIVLKSAGEKYSIVEIKDNNSEHLSYLATYILPFIGLKFDSWQSIIATIALFYVLGHIYIKTNLILTNPTLTFFGYKISSVIDSKNKNKLIIHKGNLHKNKELELVPLIDNIYILKNG